MKRKSFEEASMSLLVNIVLILGIIAGCSIALAVREAGKIVAPKQEPVVERQTTSTIPIGIDPDYPIAKGQEP